MRITFQNLTPAPDLLSEEDAAVLAAAELLVSNQPTVTPYFVTAGATTPFVLELEARGWNYELAVENAQFVAQSEIDALVSRTWNRAKKQFDIPVAETAAPVTDRKTAAALTAAQRKLADVQGSREFRIGRQVLRPLRVVRRVVSPKAKS